jgi:hypothetical protein
LLNLIFIAAGIVGLPKTCPDAESILGSLRLLQAADWSSVSSLNVGKVWPQSVEVGGTCPTCVYLSSLEHFSQSCSAASFVFTPEDGNSLRDLTVMVPLSSKKAARDYAEQAIRVIGPPPDSLVDKESDPWSRYYTWSSREDCGPNPEGCVLSMVEIGYEQYPREPFWTLIIQWTRISLD